MIVDRINPRSLGRVMGALNLIIATVAGTGATITAASAPPPANSLESVAIAVCWSGVAFVLAYPIGYLQGCLIAVLYNFIASNWGGIELWVSDPSTPPNDKPSSPWQPPRDEANVAKGSG